jgi:DNA-binding response OmpR family regulator
VLIVEDDEELASIESATILSDNGLQVSLVADGADAVSCRRGASRPDLIILDQMLPNEDGPCSCGRKLRPIFPGPIVFLTARSGWSTKWWGLELGADDTTWEKTRRAAPAPRPQFRRLLRPHG